MSELLCQLQPLVGTVLGELVGVKHNVKASTQIQSTMMVTTPLKTPHPQVLEQLVWQPSSHIEVETLSRHASVAISLTHPNDNRPTVTIGHPHHQKSIGPSITMATRQVALPHPAATAQLPSAHSRPVLSLPQPTTRPQLPTPPTPTPNSTALPNPRRP